MLSLIDTMIQQRLMAYAEKIKNEKTPEAEQIKAGNGEPFHLKSA